MRSHTHIFNTSDERKRSNMTPIHFTFFTSKEQKLVTVMMISLLQQSINTKSHLLKLSNSSRSRAHCLINLFTETQHFSNERALKTAFEQAETSSRTGLDVLDSTNHNPHPASQDPLWMIKTVVLICHLTHNLRPVSHVNVVLCKK